VTSTYVYGVSGPLEPEALPERDAEPLRVVAHRDVCAVVRNHEGGELLGRRRELLDHGGVLEAVQHRQTVLPMQFGVVAPDDDTVREHILAPNYEGLRSQLDELDDHAEFGLRGTYDDDVMMRLLLRDDPELRQLHERMGARGGGSYQERITFGQAIAQRITTARQRDETAVADRLNPHAARSVFAEPATDLGCVDAGFLVARTSVAPFREAVEALVADAGDRIRFRFVGPLPPYRFVDLRLPTPTGGA
jgi:hypothetical protein